METCMIAKAAGMRCNEMRLKTGNPEYCFAVEQISSMTAQEAKSQLEKSGAHGCLFEEKATTLLKQKAESA